jgi:cytochrome c oxidase subunit 2
MSPERRLGLTSVIVVLLLGATVAVYAIDPGGQGEPTAGGPVDGRTVFLTKGCTACHSREGASMTGQIGPDLTDLAARAGSRVPGLDAESYVRQSVLEPQAFTVQGFGPLMPTLPLTDPELDALVEFLLS